jgi:transcriptional regulator of acetoin/glycerol metabolism
VNERKLPTEAEIRQALTDANGIIVRATAILGVPRSTFQGWLVSPKYAELAQYAAQLRSAHAPPHQGRPFLGGDNRTREAVSNAWEASGYELTRCARNLGLPRSSLRHLLHRYSLPNLPASGR